MKVMNSTNYSIVEPGTVYIASGVAHILLVIIPTIILGSIVLAIFISNKKLRDPVSVVFIFSSAWSIAGPLSYGLLMDVSLITDRKVIGSCQNYSSRIFWIAFATFQAGLLVINAYMSIVHYLTIRWGINKVSLRVTAAVLFISLTVTLLICMVNFVGLSSPLKVRGSLCLHPSSFTDTMVIGGSALIFLSLPICIVVGVFFSLTIRYVKKNTIANTNLVKSVTKIIVSWTIFVIASQSVPVTAFLIRTHSKGSIVVYNVAWFFIYSVEISYPSYLLLVLFLHKTVREKFIGKCKKIRDKMCRRKQPKTIEVKTAGI